MSLAETREGATIGRNNVRVGGNPHGRPILFAHGYGCSQEIWHFVTPAFARDYRVITFDHVGAGGSDLSAYDPARYDSLHGYVDDVLQIITELDLSDVVYVGHSVSSMIGVLAASQAPERFGALVLVTPSPRYINDSGYFGGFEKQDIDDLLDQLDANFLGWSSTMGTVLMNDSDRPGLSEEWEAGFCSIDPAIASQFAKVTFLSDNRDDLASVVTPTLILQCTDDLIAPTEVGQYVHEQIAGSTLVQLSSKGHVPNLADPDQLAREIRAFLE